MPVYDYLCETCGPFEALAPMAHYDAPGECPTCQAQSPRVMRTAPGVSIVSTSTRRAHQTNERSADAPKRASQGPNTAPGGPGRRGGSKTLVRPDGSKSIAANRPWMLSY